MTSKTHNIIRILLVTATIGFSLLLFLASLFFPAFNLSNGSDEFNGISVLLMGWMGFMTTGNNPDAWIGFLGWYANCFVFPAWLGLGLSLKFRAAAFVGLILTLIGIGLAACSTFVEYVPVNEAGSTADVTSMGAGFYVWVVSFAVCALGYFAVIIWSFVKPKDQ